MADKAVGNAGTLRITDNGSTVSFSVLCGDPATFVNEYRFRVYANGAWSAWSVTSLGAGFGSRLLTTRTVNTSQTVILEQAATGTSGLGGAASFSVAISRPLPVAPSGVLVTRVSDAQQTLNWTRNATYTSVVIQRTSSGGGAWTGWQQIGIASGNAFTFTDTTTKPGMAYAYRVAGRGANGQSAWSGQSATIYTTPAAPSSVSAVRSGNNIVVSAASVPPYYTNFDVRDGSTVIATNVSMPYTHTDPDAAVPHTYTVRAHITLNNLYSAWSAASNTVQLVAPPNAPTSLSPNGSVRASDQDVVFSWKHNPVDSSPQSAFELQHRRNGGAWTTVTGTLDSQVGLNIDVGAVEWRVRTKGAHPDWSPYSAVATVTVIDRPGVAVTQPETEWRASLLTVKWTWFQVQSRPQSAWQVELVKDGGVETRSGSGGTSQVNMRTQLTPGTWNVRVRAATGSVWSEWSSETFTVVFDPPAAPTVLGQWDETQGGVQVTVQFGFM